MKGLWESILPDPTGPFGRVVERIRGTEILPNLELLRQSESWSLSELSSFRDRKLTELLQTTYRDCPWYRQRFEDAGLTPNLVFTAADLTALPILKKDDLRQGQQHGLESRRIAQMRLDGAASGGTTGDPIQIKMSREARNLAGAAQLRGMEWWGRRLGERTAVLWGRQPPHDMTLTAKLAERAKLFLTRRMYFNSFYLDDDILGRYYQQIARFRPVILRGYANSVYLMARFIQQRNLPPFAGLKLASCTSERLDEEMRAVIEDVFSVPAVNQYGCGEVLGIANECPEGRNMHVNEEHVILETVDERGQPIEGEPGRILLTDLDNFAMPLIRYELGDLGILSREPCCCGRAHPILRDVVGRMSEELVLANGRKISPAYWSVLLRPYPEIKHACVRVMSPSHLQIDMVLAGTLAADKKRYLEASVDEAVGSGITTEWRQVASIPPVRSGKTPWVRRPEQEVAL